MIKEKKFDNYLREHELTFEKLDVEGGVVAYTFNYTISGNNVAFFLFINDPVIILLHSRLMKLNNPAKREKMLYLLNQLNSKYNLSKYVLTDDDDIDFTVPFIAMEDDFNPEVVMAVTSSILSDLEEDYAKIMRVNWS